MKKLLFLLLGVILITACAKEQVTSDMTKNIRQPAVAGRFYPSDAKELTSQINEFIKQAPEKNINGKIKAIIVPHAGYDYSGRVAAYAFNQLADQKIDTVVIIGNSHQAFFDGVAVDGNDFWQTPLGRVGVNKNLAERLIKADKAIKYNVDVHRGDHILEVEIPFLQSIIKNDFKIVPIVFGNKDNQSYKNLAKALKDNLGEYDLVVASSDMSHYPKYDDANKIDLGTLEKIKGGQAIDLEKYVKTIESLGYDNEQTVLCGIDAVKTVLELSSLAEWDGIKVLKYLNSGDASEIGDKSQVVGYGSVIFYQNGRENDLTVASSSVSELNREQQAILLNIAEETVGNYVKLGKIPEFKITDERLNMKQGAFVTLNKNGELRGCIGQIVPSDEPLWQVVRDMAIAAAMEDGRFNPVNRSELDEIEYEVSILSVPEPIDDWHKIKLGRDGVILRQGANSGVFLPQVAEETGWSLEEFLSQLAWQKAGLAPDSYKDKDTELQVFQAQVFK